MIHVHCCTHRPPTVLRHENLKRFGIDPDPYLFRGALETGQLSESIDSRARRHGCKEAPGLMITPLRRSGAPTTCSMLACLLD